VPLRNKQELLKLPIYELTLPEFAWIYEDGLGVEHYRAVKAALAKGIAVEDRILKCYPSLRRRTNGKK
jgi:hypothetical protein